MKFPEGKVAAVGGGGGEGRGIGKILRGWDVVFIIEDSRFVYGGYLRVLKLTWGPFVFLLFLYGIKEDLYVNYFCVNLLSCFRKVRLFFFF